jgi:hypothetical protein
MIARRQSRPSGPLENAGRRVRMVALALALGLPAFSAAQTPAASSAGDAVTPAPSGPREIALVLPLASSTYGRAADAVRAGFEAAAERAKVKPLVIPHGDGDVVAAMTKARDAGAMVIVGPLVRDDLKMVAAADIALPWVVALNQLDDGAPLPYGMYALTLSIESDGRQLARYLRRNEAKSVVVITSDSPLQKRFAAAFVDQWLEAGGAAPATFHFDRTAETLVHLKQRTAKAPPDAALLATDASDAALARPYLGTVATCASSQLNDRQPPQIVRDLDGVCFVEIPWLADADAAAFARLKRPALPNAALDRLYALGIDAFRVAQALADGRVDRLEFDGATGHLTLDDSRVFAREGRLLRFNDGDIEPAEGR